MSLPVKILIACNQRFNLGHNIVGQGPEFNGCRQSLNLLDGSGTRYRDSSLETGIEPITSIAGETIPRVKVSAGTWVTHSLCHALGKRYLSGVPGQSVQWLPVQFISADHILDIMHREAVIGVRNARPTQQSLAAQPINRVRFATYAVNNEIKTWAQVVANTPSAEWVRAKSQGQKSIEVTHPRNALDLTLSGLTRMVLPTFIGREQEDLVQVSDELEELEHQQWLVSHQDDRHRPEVRDVIDWILDTLADENTIR